MGVIAKRPKSLLGPSYDVHKEVYFIYWYSVCLRRSLADEEGEIFLQSRGVAGCYKLGGREHPGNAKKVKEFFDKPKVGGLS